MSLFAHACGFDADKRPCFLFGSNLNWGSPPEKPSHKNPDSLFFLFCEDHCSGLCGQSLKKKVKMFKIAIVKGLECLSSQAGGTSGSPWHRNKSRHRTAHTFLPGQRKHQDNFLLIQPAGLKQWCLRNSNLCESPQTKLQKQGCLHDLFETRRI